MAIIIALLAIIASCLLFGPYEGLPIAVLFILGSLGAMIIPDS